jgi:predicted site-specific integrase-resolvase
MFVSMKKACEITGLHANTLRKYTDEGRIPHYRAPNGDRFLDVREFIERKRTVICYARVSTQKQKGDLHNQSMYLRNGYPNAELITDIGSGINFKRKGLQAILERAMCGECITLVISYRDRLARFGFDLIEWIITRSGGQIVVLNQMDTSPTEELTADLMAIITVFSARLHGLR